MKKIFYIFFFSGISGLVLSLFVINITNITLAAANRGQFCDATTPCAAGLTCGENSRCNDSTKRAAGDQCWCNAECQSGNCEFSAILNRGTCKVALSCTPDGCNGNCPPGCTVAQDPDCGCQNSNGCCGIGCTSANDNDCAPGAPGGEITFPNPLGENSDIQTILKEIWKFIFNVALFGVVPFMVIVAGFMFLTAGGNPEKIKKARELLLWLAVGVAVILLAGGIADLIKMILGVK